MTRGRIPIKTDFAKTDLVHLKVDPYGGAPSSQATPISNYFKRGNVLQGLPYNVTHYGAAGDDTTDDTGAIQAAIDAVSAAGGGTVFLPPGTYKTTATLGIKSGVTIKGAGKHGTIVKKYGAADAGEPCIAVSGTTAVSWWKVIDIRLEFDTAQTATGGCGIQVSSLNLMSAYAQIRNVQIASSFNGIHSSGVAGTAFFMSRLENVQVYGAYDWAFLIESTLNTTLHLDTCYAVGPGSAIATAKGFKFVSCPTLTMTNCACDWLAKGQALFITSCNATIIGFQQEECDYTDDTASNTMFWFVDSEVTMLNTRMYKSEVDCVGQDAYLFRVTDNARLHIENLSQNLLTETAGTYYSINCATDSEVTVDNWLDTDPAGDTNDASPYRIKRINGNIRQFTLGTKKWSYGTAAPVAGDWVRGDVFINTAPSATGYIGWSCVTAGTPGTWKGFGVIQA